MKVKCKEFCTEDVEKYGEHGEVGSNGGEDEGVRENIRITQRRRVREGNAESSERFAREEMAGEMVEGENKRTGSWPVLVE